MRKIELNGLDVSVYKEKLSNHLDVYMVPYPKKKNYFISYATYFGSDVLEFSVDQKKYKPPLGIAHFLEHKMFEQEDGVDPFTYFSQSGTDSNASTSYDNTEYICYGNKNFLDNLRYLLHFVNHPFFTDDNVLKEKGIIKEEILMYQDMPEFQLEMALRDALFHKSPRKYDIAGSVESISSITKEDLYDCYNHFYVPNNMFLLIVGNFSLEDALKVIKEEVGDIKEVELPKVIQEEEDISVSKREVHISGNIETNKLGIGLKVPIKDFSIKNNELDYYLNMITTILFGSSSLFRERVREKNLLNGIQMQWGSASDFRIFYLLATSIDIDKLFEEIKMEFEHVKISKNDFERMKKVWIANEVKMMDSIDGCVDILFDDIVKYRKVIPNKIDVIRSLDYSLLEKLIKKIDFTNYSVVKMEKSVKSH